MKTSNFANNQRYNLRGISISRYPATRNGFKGPEFPPLFPDAELLRLYKDNEITWEYYEARYRSQLSLLKPHATYAYLCQMAVDKGANEPILLCYESAKALDTQPCHRRLVAAWFEENIGIKVPEWDRQLSLLELCGWK